MRIVEIIKDKLSMKFRTTSFGITGLGLISILVPALYVLMEWIFIVTKPSFLDVFTFWEKGKVLVLGMTLAGGGCLLLMGVGYLLGRVVGLRRHPKIYPWLLSLLPAGILGALLLLLVDNFTYTLFSFGIATSEGIGRILYAVLFLLLVSWSEWQVIGAAASLESRLAFPRRRRVFLVAVGICLALGLFLAVPLGDTANNQVPGMIAGSDSLSGYPHILWITGDGVSAEHLSLYGYARDTTPNLSTLAESSLVAENMFANAKNTAGSLVSMFTGKPPLETGVLFAPDILRGGDAYQHLPGILRAQGYFSIQYGFTYYVDAYTVNILGGFDVANGRSLESSPLHARLVKYLPEEMAYFVYESGNRIIDRIRHIFFIKAMQNPYDVTVGDAPLIDDNERMDAFLDSLADFEQPLFVHLHLMGTHGSRFEPQEQVFSLGKDPAGQEDWDPDFYDDAILEFDANVGRIVSALEQHGLLENTLLVVGSDHATRSDQRQRIPLLMRFPGGKITGRIDANVQGIDIAPTILDYLELPQPDWMSGQSLLGGNIISHLIYGVGAGHLARSADGRWQITPELRRPPFFQVGAVSVLDCQVWYELSLVKLSFTTGEVIGHSSPCPSADLITAQQAYDLLLVYLQEYGYAVDSMDGRPVESLMGGE
jgi:arylsulfatase A-like enzyme